MKSAIGSETQGMAWKTHLAAISQQFDARAYLGMETFNYTGFVAYEHFF